MEIIRVEQLHKGFRDLEVLKGIDLSVKKGEIVSVIGPSGSGKSTLLRCLNHLEIADRGSISFEGKYLCKAHPETGTSQYISNKEILQLSNKMGMVFQNFNLFPHKSVLENLIEAPITVNHIPRDKATSIATDLLQKVGLLDKINAYPYQLSGGQKQRVAIARALAMQPDIMLFDEPTSALDPELIGEVLQVIKRLAQEHMTMIIVTHEMNFAAEISDRVVFMDDGKILVDDRPDKVLLAPEHPRIQAFLNKVIS